MCVNQAIGAFNRGLHNNEIKIIVLANEFSIVKREEIWFNTKNNLIKYSYNSHDSKNSNNSCKICHKKKKIILLQTILFEKKILIVSKITKKKKNDTYKYCTYCKKNFVGKKSVKN